MYGFMPSATTEKCDRPPPENRSSRPTSALPCTKACELRLVDARDRHRRQQPEDDQQAEDVQDPAPDVGRAEGVEERFEHGSGVVAGRLVRPSLGRGRLVGIGLGGGLGLVGGRRAGIGRLGGRPPARRSAASASSAARPRRRRPWRPCPRTSASRSCLGLGFGRLGRRRAGPASSGLAARLGAGLGLGRRSTPSAPSPSGVTPSAASGLLGHLEDVDAAAGAPRSWPGPTP